MFLFGMIVGAVIGWCARILYKRSGIGGPDGG